MGRRATRSRPSSRSAQNLRPNSPVRIAGVKVGKVTTVEPLTRPTTSELTAQADERADRATGDDPPASRPRW